MEWKRGPVIGRGSTATVSLATFTSTGDLFAVKSSELSNSVSLQKEEFFLSRLSSPYVVEYVGHEITQENGDLIYNVCLEYAPAGTLHDAISRNGGWLDETTIRSYTRNIILGLDYLHSKGLAHCDIKGQNILITKQGAKITDFGCARFVEEVADFSGTPAFMSPEVARGEGQGSPADVWALGCTIIEMATGKIPWSEYTDDPISALYKIGFTNEMPEFPTWLSEKGKDFLSKCLRRDPRERWTTKELLDHPFVDLKEISTNCSPNCVLDQDFWDSMDGLQSPNQNFEFEDLSNLKFSNRKSPAERMQSLIGSSFNWSEEWITVRSSEIEQEHTQESTSDSNVHEQELEVDQELFVDFSEIENMISENYNYSIIDFVCNIISFLRGIVMKCCIFSVSYCCLLLFLGYYYDYLMTSGVKPNTVTFTSFLI
ncbi:mitogen-activated protein kinase kinase kinase 18-like [Euphorbia lathyris]|uniref:mitogen-activated protein kinase kinase kinase 18-like n=1 Tax=Euphorbia lathyris TaxID=212925 RepID=UPI003313A0E9